MCVTDSVGGIDDPSPSVVTELLIVQYALLSACKRGSSTSPFSY